jgi:hypothetical protein
MQKYKSAGRHIILGIAYETVGDICGKGEGVGC